MKKSFSNFKKSGQAYLGSDDHVHLRPTPGIGTGMNAIGSAVNAANASLKPNKPKPAKPAKPVNRPTPRPASVTNFRTSDAPAKPAAKPSKPEGKVVGKFGNDSSTGSFGQKPAKPKNDKFLGRPGKGNAKTEALDKKAEKNKTLIKGFEGPRTFKDKDGKVRPTKEWAAYLKKNGSDVVSKAKPKSDHIHQMLNGRK